VTERKLCPFQVGQSVEYRPSDRARGLVLMTSEAELVPGRRYRIADIVSTAYVVVEGMEGAAGGGLYWNEFAPVSSSEDEE
jgi:hypothetical protein